MTKNSTKKPTKKPTKFIQSISIPPDLLLTDDDLIPYSQIDYSLDDMSDISEDMRELLTPTKKPLRIDVSSPNPERYSPRINRQNKVARRVLAARSPTSAMKLSPADNTRFSTLRQKLAERIARKK